jgi:hypothetical protein
MSSSEFEKFAVRWPDPQSGSLGVEEGQGSAATLLSDAQVPGAGHHVSLAWIDAIPAAGPAQVEQVLDHDQLLLHVGMDHTTPQDLGATIRLYLGGQPVVFNTTTAVFIPKGTPYGPLTWEEFRRPYVQLSLVFGSGESPAPRAAEDAVGGGAIPRKREVFDYEQYVVRSPMREAGPEFVEGRQNPTMTYLSRTQVNVVNNYLEFGWIWDVPRPSIPKMRHDNFDEIVFHIGSDPDHPADLGGILQFGIGDELLEFDTTHCAYIPRRVDHGPLIWKEVRRPLIEMALMLGAGIYAEGWENSFFDLPDGERRGAR